LVCDLRLAAWRSKGVIVNNLMNLLDRINAETVRQEEKKTRLQQECMAALGAPPMSQSLPAPIAPMSEPLPPPLPANPRPAQPYSAESRFETVAARQINPLTVLSGRGVASSTLFL
jgi:hypothetical protein